MEQNKKLSEIVNDDLASKLKDIYDSAEIIEEKKFQGISKYPDFGRHRILGNTESGIVNMDGSNVDLFLDTLTEKVQKTFSRRYLEKKIADLIAYDILQKKENKKSYDFKELLENFGEDIKKDVTKETWYLPISNLIVDSPTKLGNVTIIDPLKEDIKHITYKNFSEINSYIKKLIENKKSISYAKIELEYEYEYEKGKEESKRIIEERLNFLRLFHNHKRHGRSSNFFDIFDNNVFLDGRPYKHDHIFSEQEKNVLLPMSITYFGHPYRITPAHPMLMPGCVPLEEIVKYEKMMNPIWIKEENGEELNDFEISLLNSIHWFGKAMKPDVENKDRLVYLTTSLEALLNRKDSTKYKADPRQSLIEAGYLLETERTFEALLNRKDSQYKADPRQSLTEAEYLELTRKGRKNYSKEIDNLYGLRCGIVHGTQRKVTNEDLSLLHRHSQKLILKVIELNSQENWESKDNFFKYRHDLQHKSRISK